MPPGEAEVVFGVKIRSGTDLDVVVYGEGVGRKRRGRGVWVMAMGWSYGAEVPGNRGGRDGDY